MFTKIMLIINLLIWILMAVTGISGYIAIYEQNVAGYPNSGQTVLYIVIPLVMVLLSMVGYFLHRSGYLKPFLGFPAFLSVIAVLPYIVLSRGGV